MAVRVDASGGVEFLDLRSGRSIARFLEWESLKDAGDLYTPSPRDVKFAPKFGGCRVIHRGPVRSAIELRWSFGAGHERLRARVRLIIDADAPWVQVHVDGDNHATGHRLRLRLATDIVRPIVVVDAMFGPVERAPLQISAADAAVERPPPTAPLHRYVSLFGTGQGATLFSDGLAEYEATDDGAVFVTVLRAVGELSRADLLERPGHAGWPTPTPQAQCPGPFAARLTILLHADRTNETVDEIERAADDILLPLCGESLRSALQLPEPVSGMELRGAGLAFSAAKESEDGAWLVLRCVNLLNETSAGSWHLSALVVEAQLARLDETPLSPLVSHGGTVPFVAPARGVVTILVR